MMKTKLILLSLTSLITVACDHDSGNPVSAAEPCSGDLLFTELPPAEPTGTPAPIRFSGVEVSPVPPTALSSPGTGGVIYVPRREPISGPGEPAEAEDPL